MIRLSSPLRQGPWKTLRQCSPSWTVTGQGATGTAELGAEADAGPRQNWQAVQSELYAQLAAKSAREHFKELWPNGLQKPPDDYDYIGSP